MTCNNDPIFVRSLTDEEIDVLCKRFVLADTFDRRGSQIRMLSYVEKHDLLPRLVQTILDLREQLRSESQTVSKLVSTCQAVLRALDRDNSGNVVWMVPPDQAEGVHESANERLETVLAEICTGGGRQVTPGQREQLERGLKEPGTIADVAWLVAIGTVESSCGTHIGFYDQDGDPFIEWLLDDDSTSGVAYCSLLGTDKGSHIKTRGDVRLMCAAFRIPLLL